MCFTKTLIHKLNDIIDGINSMDTEDEEEIKRFLRDRNVEDADFFLDTLRKINKNKLGNGKKKKFPPKKEQELTYDKETVFEIFQNSCLEDIVAESSKAELAAMYYAVFCSRPLSADNKERIAQAIKGYLYAMSRAEVLLGADQ